VVLGGYGPTRQPLARIRRYFCTNELARRLAELFYGVACFSIDKADGGAWVGHAALEGGKWLCFRCTEIGGQPLKTVEVIGRQRTCKYDTTIRTWCTSAVSCFARPCRETSRFGGSPKFVGVRWALTPSLMESS
jgi:hypothetical protein